MARMRRERATTDTFILSVGSQAPGEAGRTQSPSLLIIHTGPSALDSDHSRVGGGGETTVLPWCLLKGRAVEGGVWCPAEFANICICEKEKRKGRCGEHMLGVSSLQALFYLNFTAGSRDFIPILQMRPLRLREAK